LNFSSGQSIPYFCSDRYDLLRANISAYRYNRIRTNVSQSTTMILAELDVPATQASWLHAFDMQVQRVDCALIDACEAEPTTLESAVRGTPDANASVLVLAMNRASTQRTADVVNWNAELHTPLKRCFTVVRGLVPWISRAPRAQVIALLPIAALLPNDTSGATQGASAVLGRALLGLLEGLRAELHQTSTRVTICIIDAAEPAAVFKQRLQNVLHTRPFHSLPASVDGRAIEQYFAPMMAALAQTPAGIPLPAGPMGDVYRLDQLSDQPSEQ
jgi:hypothetical protein